MSGSAESVIRARALRKVYRLYASQGYKFLDMFGMLGVKPGAFTEHAALDGVDLDVRRGEKVAFIGRNGAGKSTLLKLITNVVQPTSGVIEVKGKVHALLQIGTGFHPDFTGRENVLAYLAQLGVTGRDAERKYADIVEFAELEEYISQPVKTYSSGMAVRLMFSTATAITPELLVLDEVLGVGDAYFAQKSYERMRELCEGSGTTLLLVTHDIYSAVKMCERLIWVDRGRILMDGAGPLVIKAYEDSIRQQEESRLRVKKQERLKSFERETHLPQLLFEIGAADGRPLEAPVYFSRIALSAGGCELASVPLGTNAFDETLASHLQKDASSWGDLTTWQGRPSRPMQNYGGSFHKIAGVLAVALDGAQPPPDLRLDFDYWTESTGTMAVRCFWDKRALAAGSFAAAPGVWARHAEPIRFDADVDARGLSLLNTSGVHGSGAIVVRGARLIDAAGTEAYAARHGEAAAFEIDVEVVDPALSERSQVVIALHRDGVQDVCRWIARDLTFAGAGRRTVRLRIPKLLLTDGDYSVTILIAREGYYDRDQTKFFTINRDVYHCASRMFDFVVRGSGLIGSGTVTVADGSWELDPIV